MDAASPPSDSLSPRAPCLRGRRGSLATAAPVALALAAAVAIAGCVGASTQATPRPIAGTPASPRDVNIVAKDFTFEPPEVDLIPGETVLLHVVNGGLAWHEVVIGNQRVQDAWEVAEAATVNAPPGPTPVVSVPPDVAGLRVVVASGQRVDVRWTVPTDATAPLIVGCHIPGHYAKGMYVPIVLVPSAPG